MLISDGNDRQRKALDGIREQAALWAMQDLRLKREKLAREVKVDDPLAWLNQVVAKVYGENLGLMGSYFHGSQPNETVEKPNLEFATSADSS